MEKSVEKELIKLIRDNDIKAFEILFKLYYPRLCAYAQGYLRVRNDAEDIVKDTFVTLWIKRDSIQITSSLSGYLYRSVRNGCINYIQRDLARRPILTDDGNMEKFCDLPDLISRDYPINILLADEMEERIRAIIADLPQKCRQIFEMSRFENMENGEIAQKLGLSPNTVKVQVFKALTKLREGLTDYLPALLLFFTSMT